MILENMTLPEIKNHLLKDRAQLMARAQELVFPFYREYLEFKRNAKKRLAKIPHFKKCFTLISNRKNKWFIWIEPDLMIKGECLVSYHCMTIPGKYPALISFDVDFETMQVYTGHFLKRFNERLMLGLETTEQKAKEFSKTNPSVYIIDEQNEVDAMIFTATGILSQGIALGELDKYENIFLAKTYISENEYQAAQKEKVVNTKKEFSKHLLAAKVTGNPYLISNCQRYFDTMARLQ